MGRRPRLLKLKRKMKNQKMKRSQLRLLKTRMMMMTTMRKMMTTMKTVTQRNARRLRRRNLPRRPRQVLAHLCGSIAQFGTWLPFKGLI